MGIVERRLREKEERRKLILEAAKALVQEKGVAGFSMQDIADVTELGKATIYLYFQSKEAILEEIFRDAVEYFVEYVEERLPPDSSGLESLLVLWGSYLSLYAESGDVFVLIGIYKAVSPTHSLQLLPDEEAEKDPAWAMLELISQVLRLGIKDGTLDPGIEPITVARTSLLIATALIDEAARLPRELRDPRRIRDELRNTFNLLLRGVAAPGADRSRLYLT